jgi:DNA-binding transcriptional regulator YhcF (GntR family)
VTDAGVRVDTESTVPPFEQVRAQIASQAASGALSAGTRLPTVRQLAAELGLAVNTVARAYRELEADAVITTEGRRGTFIRSDAVASGQPAAAELARSYVSAARQLGLTCAEATRLVEQTWQG